MKKPLPKILQKRQIAKSRLFTIEALDLEFSNGNTRTYERLASHAYNAVMICAFLDENTFLLTSEYAVGAERYVLGFPKGLIDKNETILEAANRELQEELGYSAQQLKHVHSMYTAAGHLESQIHIVLAQDLHESSLPGDEPEPLPTIPWQRQAIHDLIKHPDFIEARSLAALCILQNISSGK